MDVRFPVAFANALVGLVTGVTTLAVLAVRRALDGRSGVDFADLGTAAAVGVVAALVPAVLQLIAIRTIHGPGVSPGRARRPRSEGSDAGGWEPGDPGPASPSAIGSRRGDRFDKFTARARHVLTLAQDEAQRFGHNYIGTEHLLLGLVREREGLAARVLESMNVELAKVREAVEFIIGRGDQPVVGEVGLTPRAKRVIELAIDEARRLGHNYVGTEHLLLGLVREGEGIAAGVLESLDANLRRVREETILILILSRAGPAADDEPAS
jgi:Clp amino terminal domain, pathogenicity island component